MPLAVLICRIAIFLCGCVAFIDLYSTQGILPELSATFNLRQGQANLSISATTLAVALSAPLLGLAARTANRKNSIIIASLALSFPTALCAISPNFDFLLVARFIQGILIPIIFTMSISYIADGHLSDSISICTGIFVAGTTFGGFCSRALLGVSASMFGWRSGFIIAAAINLIVGLIITAFLPDAAITSCGRQKGGVPSLYKAIMARPFIVAYICGFSALFGQVAAFTYISLYLARPPYQLNASQEGWIFAVFLFPMLVLPFIGSWIDKLGYRTSLILASLTSAAGILMTLSHVLPQIFIGLSLAACGVFTAQTVLNASVAASSGPAKSVAVGVYLMAYYFGGTAGAIVPTPVWNHYGWLGCAVLIIGAQLFTAVLGGLFLFRMHAPEQVGQSAQLTSRA